MKQNKKLWSTLLFLFCCVILVISSKFFPEGDDQNTPTGTDTNQTINQDSDSTNVTTNTDTDAPKPSQSPEIQDTISLQDIPEYNGEPYVILNDNQPAFTDADLTETSFETYGDLDSLGRCTVAYANVGLDLMPTEKRGNISQVKPTGWQSATYDIVDGKHLYNRCHLIGYQLSGENANNRNLITGTRYMNVDGMLPFENMIADYVKETGNHVLYRVTPIFNENNLVADGVQMEAYSVEDDGEGVCFHVFAYNVQPGIEIDYATGSSSLAQIQDSEQVAFEGEIRGNSRSKVYHCPGQSSYDEMADSKHLVIFQTEQDAINAGYRKAQK